MMKALRFLRFIETPDKEFKPYYEKENSFRRLVIIHSIAAFVITPIYCFFVYQSDLSDIYFYLGLSYTVLFPLYMLICWFVPFFREKLIYFFILHLFGMTYFAFIDLVHNQFDLLDLFSFYCLFAVIVFVMQRLYPVIIYNLFVLGLLLYGLQYVSLTDISGAAMFGVFGVLALCSVVVLYSRQKMIHSVEDYSNYLKRIMNNSGVGYILFQFDEANDTIRISDLNDETFKLLNVINFDKEAVIKKFSSKFSKSELYEIEQIEVGNNIVKQISFEDSSNTQRFFDVSFTILPLKNGKYYLARLTDISKRIQEREDLILSEEKYRNLYYRNQAGVFTVDKKSVLIDYNETFELMFGNSLKKGEAFVKDENMEEWNDIVDVIQSQKNLRNYQTHFTIDGGETKWFVFNWFLDNKTGLIEGTVIDLTEVQKATIALRQSEQKYRLIYEESNDAILLLDDDRIIDVNRRGIQLFGMSDKELLKKNLIDLSLDSNEESIRKYRQHKQKLHLSRSTKFNWFFQGNTGAIEAEVAIVELIYGDKLLHQCVIHDVTERNETIRSLDKSKKSFQSILENTPEGILIVRDNEILYANKEMFSLVGNEEIEFGQLFKGMDQSKFFDLFKEQQEKKGIFQSQFNLNRSDDSSILTDVTLVSTLFSDQEATLIIIKDISLQNQLSKEVLRAELAEETNKRLEKEVKERRIAERKLKDLFLRTKAIFDSSSNTLLLTLSPTNQITSYNLHCENYFFDKTKRLIQINEDFGSYFREVFSERDIRYFEILLRTVRKGESKQIESRYTINGMTFWLDIFINPIFDSEGKIAEISMVAHDITEKKKSAQEIIDSLQEKEVLLKEIHHRVKNNLQVISSILNLQSSFVHDDKTLDLLQESRNRIRSMAMIHENLYRTTNFASINFSGYILNLATNLVATYRLSEEYVELNYDMQQVDLVLDQAIPCGLLVNELITNAIKYAFPNNRKGIITIELKEKGDLIELLIQDNGVGLPENFIIEESDTLGLQLVLTLVEQLDGQIQLTNSSGTEFLITFEKTKL